MSFIDRFGMALVTIAVGLTLTLVGVFTENDALVYIGLPILGSGLGMPISGKWSESGLLAK